MSKNSDSRAGKGPVARRKTKTAPSREPRVPARSGGNVARNSEPKKAFVTISDMHVGSDGGLWAPDFRTVEKQRPVPQSAFQQWLWSCWTELPAVVRALSPEATQRTLVINGDVIEGIHHNTPELMVHTKDDMMANLKMCFAPFVGVFHRFLLTRGTECHVGLAEIGLGQFLGPDCIVSHKLRLQEKVTRINMMWRHHCQTTSRVHLEGSALRNEWGQEAMEAVRCGYPAPHVLTMAHRHVPDLLTEGQTIVGVTGPWQALTTYGHKVARHGVAKPSVLVYDFTGKGRGELPEARQHVWVPKLQPGEVIEV